jgi:EAL and modified HD-GYP domain-containing signal transduction protein
MLTLLLAGGCAVLALAAGLLARARARQAGVLAAAGEAVLATDKSGKVTFANPAAGALLGTTDATGRPLDAVAPGAVAAAVAATLHDGDRRTVTEKELQRPDGSVIAVHATVSAARGAVVVLRDVTVAERELDGLRRSEAELRGVVETAEDWVWVADRRGVITYSNPAGRALLGREDLIGRRIGELVSAGDRRGVAERTREAASAGRGWTGLVRRPHGTGGHRTLDSRSVAILDERGTVTGWRGIDRDAGAWTPFEPSEPAVAAPAVNGSAPAGDAAAVRVPIVDGRRDVMGYEVLVDGEGEAPELEKLGGGLPLWLPMPPDGQPPALEPGRAVLQVPADAAVAEQAARLAAQGWTLAVSGPDAPPELLDVCGIVKVPVDGRDDDELTAAIAEPSRRGALLVATGVATTEDFTRCRVLGFSRFQGDFFGKPRQERPRGADIAGLASLEALAELAVPNASFEDLERTIGSDVGLSLSLLRHVNSAFFSLPREVRSVHEALTLLGTTTVRRWAMVMALSALPDAPSELVALALLRARMCELLGAGRGEESDRLFTVGLFSVADALVDAPLEDVLEPLPFDDQTRAALLRGEGYAGELLEAVVEYERGHFPADPGDGDESGVPLASAYLAALEWAEEAGRTVVPAAS